MPAVRTMMLPRQADYLSPGGAAEIRMLLQFPAGELTHVLVPASTVSVPAWVSPSAESFYITAGYGRLWTGTSDLVELVPGRCVHIPSGTPFQYRSDGTAIELLLAAVPQWRSEYHHILPEGRWTPTICPAAPLASVAAPRVVAAVAYFDLRDQPSHTAPDGSQIRLLGSDAARGIAHSELPAGHVSFPVRHRTVEEIWYVLDGHGELGRRTENGAPEITVLRAGICIDIAVGITFQLRATSLTPLQILILTMPESPGADEAVIVDDHAMFQRAAAT